MAAETSLLLRLKAEADPTIGRALKAVQDLVNLAGKDATTASAAFDQLAKVFVEIANATGKANTALAQVSKASKESAAERGASAKQLAAETKAAEAAAAAAAKTAEAEKRAARKKAADELKAYLEYEERQRKVAAAAAQEEARIAAEAARQKAEAEKKSAEAAKTARDAFKDVGDGLQDMGTRASVGLGVISVGLTGLALKAANTAREFESFEAQLKTITGSATEAQAKFAGAKDFAVKTPFDVKEIVQATVTLEAYKQKSEDALPQVAALAAGMNKELGATALVVGKAMSGSLEGFESLRNEYGITTRELVKFGAETNKAGGILTQTAEQAEKARNALSRIIEVRFGEALADRAKTVSAAVSNAGDAIISFAASVGEGVAPLVKFGAVLTTKFVGALDAMPPAMKAGLGATLALGAGVTGLGSVALAGTLALVKLDTELAKLVVANTAAAASTELTNLELQKLAVSGAAASRGAAATGAALNGLGKVGSVFGRVGAVLAPIAGLLAGITAVAGAGYLAIQQYGNEQEAMGRKVSDASKKLAEQTFTARTVSEELGKIGGKSLEAALSQKELSVRSAELSKVIKSLPATELANSLQKLNLGPEELKKTVDDLKTQTAAAREELKGLLAERNKLAYKPRVMTMWDSMERQ